MGSEPPSLELVAAYVRHRQRATLAALAAVVPVAATLGLIALACVMVNGGGVALLAMLWPVAIIARVAANLVDERRALAVAARLLTGRRSRCRCAGGSCGSTARAPGPPPLRGAARAHAALPRPARARAAAGG
jgi:hypothetical protein